MHGDTDPEIDGFLCRFLGEGARRAQPAGRRARHSRWSTDELIDNGLALDLADIASLAPHPKAKAKAKARAQRNEKFCQLLEDMANDIMENGPVTEVMPSREVTPRSSVSPPPEPAELDWNLEPSDAWAECLPRMAPDGRHEADPPEHSANDGSSDDASDADDADHGIDGKVVFRVVEADNLSPAEPSNQIRVSVSLNTGRCILDKVKLDLDSTVENLFDRVEEKLGKQIQTLITTHGHKLERADFPIKWSGLQDDDTITALQSVHPPVEARRFVVAAESEGDSLAKPLQENTSRKDAPSEGSVSMGAFGDEIAAVAKSVRGVEPGAKSAASAGPVRKTRFAGFDVPNHWKGPSSRPVVADPPSADPPDAELPSHWSDACAERDDSAVDVGEGLADHWLAAPVARRSGEPDVKIEPGTGATDRDAEVVPILPNPLGMPSFPIPPDCMPDEFEDLPADAWQTPPSHADGPLGHSQSRAGALEEQSPLKTEIASVSKPRATRNLASPPPPEATTSPMTNRHDLSFAPTPSRRTLGPLRQQQRPDAEEQKRRQEDMQKRSDQIWANIAATLEPAGAATTASGNMGRKSLSVPALAGSGVGNKRLGKRR